MGAEAVILVFLLINFFGFMLMRSDKERAKNKEFRISEKTLWWVAILGGATGMTLAMRVFRHKTKHFQFKFGLPIVMVAHFICVVFVAL